ncbi:MAG: hypothetical protein ACI9SJ_002433 [Flavobacteriaceae bacterium]|jgi:hypothetical protein
MKKSYFKDQTLYWVIIIILGGLLIWNSTILLAYQKLIGLLPILIQTVLLILISTKHEYAKIGIKIWTISFLIVGPSLQFFGRLLNEILNGFEVISIQHYAITGLKITIGILIILYTDKTVVVEVKQE